MAVCVKVYLDDIIYKLDTPYDYYITDPLDALQIVGKRVIVPFSRGNVRKKGLVVKAYECESTKGLKSVLEIVDKAPVLSEWQIKLAEFIKEHYFTTFYRAVKCMLPPGIDFKVVEYYTLNDLKGKDTGGFEPLIELLSSSKKPVRDDKIPTELKKQLKVACERGLIMKSVSSVANIGSLSEKQLRLNCGLDQLDSYISKLPGRSQKQKDLLQLFFDSPQILAKEAVYYSGCSTATINSLKAKGIIEIIYNDLYRNPYKSLKRSIDKSEILLNIEQQIAYEQIEKEMSGYYVHMLYGVTGSGKTHVFLKLIDRVLASGRSVLFLVPEISLTPQMMERFYQRYGDNVAVIHSGLSMGERADEWRKIKSQKAKLVVGTRSAVFAPADNLGLIIMDEEHEASYKAENTPRYHARDIAMFLCKMNNIPLVLASATPSIESFYQVRKGSFKLHVLKNRYHDAALPQTTVIDMRTDGGPPDRYFLSEQMVLGLESNLKNKNQSILFLNRRGAHTLAGCRSCGFVAKCPNCGISLTYHSVNNRCMCHYCGYSIPMFDSCPQCSSKHIKMLGIGTQLVADTISNLLPSARILRMDYDSVSSYLSYGEKLMAFKRGEYDIMLGTQMVAKGLDFPNVTLVGVINADLSLYIDDFRANERTFSLLTQVCGRSGRADKPGLAYIQTYTADNEVIEFAKRQDYDSFYDYEIKFRKAINYPPFCDLLLLTTSSFSQQLAYKGMMELYNFIDKKSKAEYSSIPIRLMAPNVPKISRLNNKYRFNLLVKCRQSKKLRELVNECVKFFDSIKDTELSVNLNPINYF